MATSEDTCTDCAACGGCVAGEPSTEPDEDGTDEDPTATTGADTG